MEGTHRTGHIPNKCAIRRSAAIAPARLAHLHTPRAILFALLNISHRRTARLQKFRQTNKPCLHSRQSKPATPVDFRWAAPKLRVACRHRRINLIRQIHQNGVTSAKRCAPPISTGSVTACPPKHCAAIGPSEPITVSCAWCWTMYFRTVGICISTAAFVPIANSTTNS